MLFDYQIFHFFCVKVVTHLGETLDCVGFGGLDALVSSDLVPKLPVLQGEHEDLVHIAPVRDEVDGFGRQWSTRS